jgi:hypothetical protein
LLAAAVGLRALFAAPAFAFGALGFPGFLPSQLRGADFCRGASAPVYVSPAFLTLFAGETLTKTHFTRIFAVFCG